MPKQIRLNAFDMNCVGHQSPGLWTHPRDRADRYNTLDYWVDLARTLERGKFDALFLADVLGVYDVYRGSPDAAIAHAVQVPVNDPLLLVPAMAYAAEVLQMRLRMLAFAIGRIEEQRRRRSRAHEWALIANVSPQAASLGLAGAWCQNRHRRVVDMQSVAAQEVSGERVDQRLQRRRRLLNPAAPGRGLKAHSVASEDLGWAVERQVVVIFRHDEMSQ